MTRKLDAQEPLLNTVARKLGRAAGTLANLTHKITTEQPAASHPVSQAKSVQQPKNPASARQNRAAKQSRGTRKTRAAASGTASRQGTIRTKSRSRRKG
jgi:hypothetical protein